MRRRGPRGYVPARRGPGRPTPVVLAPNLQRARDEARQAYRESRERSRPWTERLRAAQRQHALERGYASRAAWRRALKDADARYGVTAETRQEISRQRYWEIVRDFREARGLTVSLQDVRTREDFRRVLLDLYSTNTAPDGPLARALVQLGRRDPTATYRVGETPK